MNYICDSTFRNYLRESHSYKREVCIGAKVNCERIIEWRYNFAKKFLTYLNAGLKFIYIDE